MYAEAEAATEKMKVSETLCKAIADRADMFNGLLDELNDMFSGCTAILDGITLKKMGMFKNKAIKVENLSDEELKLIAVTRSLAGAVKAIIDTPILSKDGNLSHKSQKVYEETTKALPEFAEIAKEVESNNYSVNPLSGKVPSGTASTIRNVFALALGVISALWFTNTFWTGALLCTIIVMLIMDTNTDSRIFEKAKNIANCALGIVFAAFLYMYAEYITSLRFFTIGNIVVGVVLLILFAIAIPNSNQSVGSMGNIRKLFIRILGCLFCFTIVLLLFVFLYGLLGLSFNTAIIISLVLYTPVAIGCSYLPEDNVVIAKQTKALSTLRETAYKFCTGVRFRF